jgi:hypothetical protein
MNHPNARKFTSLFFELYDMQFSNLPPKIATPPVNLVDPFMFPLLKVIEASRPSFPCFSRKRRREKVQETRVAKKLVTGIAIHYIWYNPLNHTGVWRVRERERILICIQAC